MSKKMLKRSLALGALMAFVITGSAMAADVPNNYEAGKVLTGAGLTVNGYGTITGAGDLTIESTDNNAVTINEEGEKLTITANQGSITLDAYNNNGNAILAYDNLEITAKDTLNMYAGNRVIRALGGAEVNLTADKIYMNQNEAGDGSYTLVDDAAIKVTDGAKLNVTATNGLVLNAIGAEGELVDAVYISGNGSKVTLDGGTDTRINGSIYATAYQKSGATEENITVNIKGDNIVIDAKGNKRAVEAWCDYPNALDDQVKLYIGEADENGKVLTQKIDIQNFTGAGIYLAYNGTLADIKTEELNIISKNGGTGLYAASGTSDAHRPDNNSEDSARILIGKDTVTTIEVKDVAIAVMSEAIVDIKGNLTATANDALLARGNALVNINADDQGKSLGSTVVLNGDVNFNWSYNSKTNVDANVNINLDGEGSEWNGNTKISWDKKATQELDTSTLSVQEFNLRIENGAEWNPNAIVEETTSYTDSSGVSHQEGVVYTALNNLVLNDGTVNVVSEKMNGQTLEIDEASGMGTFAVDSTKSDQVVIGKKGDDTELTVTTTNQELELKDLVDVVSTKNADGTTSNAADVVEKTGGTVYEKESATVTDGELGAVTKVVDAANIAVNDMAAIGLMSWRAEMNDMNKRMGELRNANGEHGVWVRMVRGESEYNSVKNQYNQYQLGYDEKLSVDKRWTVGVALSYTDAENNFAQGSGESTNKALSIYGSKLNDDGTFVDLIAKYARLENDFETFGGMGAADYDANGYSFSAEFGKRIQQGKGLWIEPQVELTYGKVGSVDYVTKNKVNVAQDGMESLVGRIGFSLGKDIEKGNVYARASYLYDFDGETKATLNNDAVLENDLGGGWWEVGVGANINLSKVTYIYADVEKTFGGEVDTNWQWNLGVRYSF